MLASIDDLSLADLESAKPSASFMANVMIEKKEKALRRAQAIAEARQQAEAGAKAVDDQADDRESSH
jgi:hypothetical protein